MDADQSIIQLGIKLDAWWDRFSDKLDSEDRVAQVRALLQGFEIAKEFDRIKTKAFAAIRALLDDRSACPQDKRTDYLIRGFVLGARLGDTLHDEFSDMDGETNAVRLTDAIVKDMDTIGPGRSALAGLLDHPNAGVRALAGAYLIDLMPAAVIPVLREVKVRGGATSAHFRAFWTLLAWERERKSRFNYLSQQASSLD
jgi:hypothetical protein